MNAAALILAAGYSSRMGEFKPLIPICGTTAIERIVQMFHAAGVDDLIVVTGHRSDDLAPVLDRSNVRQVFNPNYDVGMFSSIRTGVGALEQDVDACLVLPADTPLVRPLTVELLLRAYEKCSAEVTYPVFQKRRGHPPLVRRSVLAETLSRDGDGGLRAVLALHDQNASDVEVVDEGIHLDIDTPADLDRAQELSECRHAPSVAECAEILERHRVDQRIVRHSSAVAAVARRLATALPVHDTPLDFAVLRAGALLHDLAKGKPDHAHLGAHILEELRFPEVARVIACHGDLDSSAKRLDEAAIVYLADKLVRGDRVVSLQQRFEPAYQRFHSDPEALQAIDRRLQNAERIARDVEAKSGRLLEEILTNGN